MTEIELSLRVLVGFQFALLAAAFTFARKQRPDQLWSAGTLLCGAVVAFSLASIQGASDVLGWFYWPLVAWCLAKPALLYFLSRAFFADRFRWQRSDLLGLAMLIATGLIRELLEGREGYATASVIHFAIAATYLVSTPIHLWVEQKGDLDNQRRRVRLWVLGSTAAYLTATLLIQLGFWLLDVRTPPILMLANLAVLLVAGVAVGTLMVRVQIADWVVLGASRKLPGLNANERAVLRRLQTFMAAPRWYADASLTLPALARRLATNEQSLRTVISGGLGHRHFNDFLHRYRLDEAVTRLSSNAFERESILAIALDCGFRSIGPFNRAFRERFQMSPREYRRRRQHKAGLADTTSMA